MVPICHSVTNLISFFIEETTLHYSFSIGLTESFQNGKETKFQGGKRKIQSKSDVKTQLYLIANFIISNGWE